MKNARISCLNVEGSCRTCRENVAITTGTRALLRCTTLLTDSPVKDYYYYYYCDGTARLCCVYMGTGAYSGCPRVRKAHGGTPSRVPYPTQTVSAPPRGLSGDQGHRRTPHGRSSTAQPGGEHTPQNRQVHGTHHHPTPTILVSP